MATRKPQAYNNNWLGNTVTTAELQVINEETNKFDTLGTCIDTPNALAKELQDSKYQVVNDVRRGQVLPSDVSTCPPM